MIEAFTNIIIVGEFVWICDVNQYRLHSKEVFHIVEHFFIPLQPYLKQHFSEKFKSLKYITKYLYTLCAHIYIQIMNIMTCSLLKLLIISIYFFKKINKLSSACNSNLFMKFFFKRKGLTLINKKN